MSPSFELIAKFAVLLIVPILVTWGAHVVQQGRLRLAVGFKSQISGRNARIAGLIAILEGLAGISYILGHNESALWVMALTLPLLASIAFSEVAEQLA